MNYTLYNSLSRSASKLVKNTSAIDVQTLDSSFFENLTDNDEVTLYGGDGTINHFINNCIIYPKLTIVKCGTGNDFVRSLSKEYQTVKIYEVNGYKFINGFGTGFDADVCKLANEQEKKSKYSFFKCVYKGLIKAKQQTITITVDGINHTFQNAFLATFQNGSYFGGGVKIVPNRKVTDDGLEVCVISNGSKLLLASLFPTAFIGLHPKFKKYVTIISGNQFEVNLENPYISQCDGEVQAETDYYKISLKNEIEVRVK